LEVFKRETGVLFISVSLGLGKCLGP
jgi:hypothetical protein